MSQPQRKPDGFAHESSLAIAKSAREPDWFVNDITIGNRSDFLGQPSGEIDQFLSFETVETSIDIVMTITYTDADELYLDRLFERWPAMVLLLRGLQSSTGDLENGLVAWIDGLGDALAAGAMGTVRYYQIEIPTYGPTKPPADWGDWGRIVGTAAI